MADCNPFVKSSHTLNDVHSIQSQALPSMPMLATSAASAHQNLPLGTADHHVLDLSHYQRVSPVNPDSRDFIVATIQHAENPNRRSFLRLERSRQGVPHTVRHLPPLYRTNPIALCLLRDFLIQNISYVPDDAKLVFRDVLLALTAGDADIPVDGETPPSVHIPDLKARLRNFSDGHPEDEGDDTVTTIRGHPLPEEATLIEVAHRSSGYPLSIVLLACTASAAHLFDPVYRLFQQQSFWFAKVLMGVFLADGHVSTVQIQLPARLVEDEVDYGEDGEPKLVKCVVEDLLLETIHETRFCRDQMFGGFVAHCKVVQEDRDHALKLRKKLKDSETWIQEYRLKLETMLKLFSPDSITSISEI